jgi:hypothetical protein
MSAQPGELGLHSGKNQNRSIQVWKNIGCLDEYEVVQGSCVSYGRLHLQAELPVCLAILLNVFQHVFQCDAMALQRHRLPPGSRNPATSAVGQPKSCARGTLLD